MGLGREGFHGAAVVLMREPMGGLLFGNGAGALAKRAGLV